eukprot:1156148-Pelagomonas_calceolata.AAC.3
MHVRPQSIMKVVKWLKFGAGEMGRSDVLAWVRAASSKASQVMSQKGLHSSLAQGKVVSAEGVLSP